MRLSVETGGRVRSVAIVHRNGALVLTIDGKAFQVDAERLGAGRLSLRLTESGRQHDVLVTPAGDPAEVQVLVDGRVMNVRLRSEGRGVTRVGHQVDGPERVMAPMPGKVVKLLARVGDTVAARQAVVVVEAMKMENELRASRAGVVRDVLVVEGASVEAGAALLVIA
jgi:biotin carboxyl carrier protein